MSQNKLDGGSIKKPLTGKIILNIEHPAKTVTLSSGSTVIIKYISMRMIEEIMNSLKDLPENLKAQHVSKETARYLLRENNIQDLMAFSINDRKSLFEIAAKEWGCHEEYEEYSNINSGIERFYFSVLENERRLFQKLKESFTIISQNLTSQLSFPTKWIGDYQKSLSSLISPLTEYKNFSRIFIETTRAINYSVIDQFSSIAQFIEPISKILGNLGKSINSHINDTLIESTKGVFSSYETLMESVIPLDVFIKLPEAIRFYPTIEMHNTSVVIRQLSKSDEKDGQNVEIVIPQKDSLIVWLNCIDSSFGKMLRGAEQTIYSDNPEKIRHFTSSHRELETHLLHHFAPNEAIEEWTDDPNFYRENKPTRRARLKYISRNFVEKDFVEFFIKDGLNQMDLLNSDEHRKTHNYSKTILVTLHNRFLSWLSFLREIMINDDFES